jgi:hypothetical protein
MYPRTMSHTLTTPSADPEAKYDEVGSALQTWTGASWARATTRMGWIIFPEVPDDVGISYIRRDREDVNTSRCADDDGTHRDVIGCVS